MRQHPTTTSSDRPPIDGLALTRLDPADYGRAPWKNGGGVTIDIAALYRDGAVAGSWNGLVWRLGRTAIVAPAPFSDLSGHDRQQVVVTGRGLVLDTPEGEIDLREPFRPTGYDGGLSIVSRLEDGPVEVVNLIADRNLARVALAVLHEGSALFLQPGTHIVYAAAGPIAFEVDGAATPLAHDQALRIDAARPLKLRGEAGRGLIASIYPTTTETPSA
ncbi:HutD/Ves family protein [Bosea sp. (in: a-proteobacteria)]|uniref:HutD/Ves family protein n=1 Tax=Bosea sp. (in: a-proteobacteria) TaxID=1871050 RepID=UPI002FC8DEF4